MLGIAAPAFAARPLLDRHQWDAYFALYARDANVPWKPTTVRLDTYSGAPVDFAAYNVDPADVVVPGASGAARAVDTSHLKAVVRWRFSPPAGYRFEANDVSVPLGTQEGFYVVEARRGDAVQQVWLNRTHVGLLTQESPEGLVVWGVDLRTGRAIAHMNVAFQVGTRRVSKATDGDGLVVWRERLRPTFALAGSGAGRAFVSILPQAPPPSAIVGFRLDSAGARAGERVRFVGFARKRVAGAYRRATGDVRVTVAGRGATLASALAHLDGAGAFAGELALPATADAGDYAILASAAGVVGGTGLHIDAASDVTLAVRSSCPCDSERDVPLAIVARRGDAPAPDTVIRVQIVRAPHVVPPGGSDEVVRWGTTLVYDRSVRADASGLARVLLSSPSDGLDSTYIVRASTRGASATARLVVPSARVALSIETQRTTADVGEAVAFDVRGFDASDGSPAAGLAVRVRLSHGASAQEQNATLDERGRAHIVFRQASLGSNLALAQATVDGRHALDATDVLVQPSALAGRTLSANAEVNVALDKTHYRGGDRIAVRANAPGASGDALFAITGARTYALRRSGVASGSASATFPLGDPQGAVRVDAAFVRNGTLAVGSADVRIDGPGRPLDTTLTLDKPAYAQGDVLHATLHDGGSHAGATLALRIADGHQSGSADFTDVAQLLAAGATSEQAPASSDPQWHTYVAPARSKASDIFAAERPRKVASEVPLLGAAETRTTFWRIDRASGDTVDVPVPKERGHYVLSIMRIADDGDVGAASAGFNVVRSGATNRTSSCDLQ